MLDEFIPKYYEVARLGVQIGSGGGVTAVYDIIIRNAEGKRIGSLNPTSVLTQQERAAIAAIFQRDKTEFETQSQLTEWGTS